MYKILASLVIISRVTFVRSCDRVLFEQPTIKDFPYASIIDGTFIKTNKFVSRAYNTYPVYEKEDGSVLLFYNPFNGNFVFTNTRDNLKGYIKIPGSPVHRNRTYYWHVLLENENDISDIIAYFNYKEAMFLLSSTKDVWNNEKFTLKPRCSYVGKCPTDSLIIDLRNSYANFKRKNNLETRNGRPVYYAFNVGRYIKSDYILYYKSGRGWIISDFVFPRRAYYQARSNALSPELIGAKWFKNGLHNIDTMILVCKGEKRACSKDYCKNNGICRQNNYRNIYCACKEGYRGKYCQEIVPLCKTKLNPPLKNINQQLGAISIKFCYENNYRTARCVETKNVLEWKYENCPDNVTEIEKVVDINWDRDMPKIDIALMVIFGVLTTCLPCMHFTCCGGRKHTTFSRIYSMYWSCGVFAWLIFIILAYHFNFTQYGANTFKNLLYFAIASASIFYAYILLETCCSSESKYLCVAKKDKDAEILIKALLQGQPSIVIYGESYHYEFKTRTITVSNSNGDEETRTETSQEKIVSWKGDEIFYYEICNDISNVEELPNLEYSSIVQRFKFHKDLRFANEETETAYENFKKDFNMRHENQDTYFESQVKLELAGFKKRVTAYPETLRPIWMNCCCFCMFTTILLTWPFRFLLNTSTRKHEFTFVKVINISPSFPLAQTIIPLPDNETVYKKTPDNACQSDSSCLQTEASAPPPQEMATYRFPTPPEQNPAFATSNQQTNNSGYNKHTEVESTSFIDTGGSSNHVNTDEANRHLLSNQNDNTLINVDDAPPSYNELFGRRT